MKTERPFTPPNQLAALERLKRRYPAVCMWFGNSTYRYWALVNNLLVEAATPDQLEGKIDSALRARWQHTQRYGRTSTDQRKR
jgi:hypothetical protein